MGEDMLLVIVMLFFRLLVLPLHLLFRRGLWQGLRLLSFGVFLAVFLGDLHAADWNPVVWVAGAGQAQLVPLATASS